MNLRRNYIWIVPLLAMVTSPLWWKEAGRLLGPKVSEMTAAPSSPSQKLNTFVLHRVVMSQNRAGRDELLVKADSVQSGQSADELQMFAVDGQLFGDQRSLQISGKEANYDSTRQIFTVSEQVKLTTSDGYLLETELLRYFPKFRKVKTAESVSLAGSGLKLRGEGVVYDMLTGDFRVGGRVVVDLS
jgi:LPS export ABC transporter protein LptC